MRSLSLRPDDSLTIPKVVLSIGFIRFVASSPPRMRSQLQGPDSCPGRSTSY